MLICVTKNPRESSVCPSLEPPGHVKCCESIRIKNSLFPSSFFSVSICHVPDLVGLRLSLRSWGPPQETAAGGKAGGSRVSRSKKGRWGEPNPAAGRWGDQLWGTSGGSAGENRALSLLGAHIPDILQESLWADLRRLMQTLQHLNHKPYWI